MVFISKLEELGVVYDKNNRPIYSFYNENAQIIYLKSSPWEHASERCVVSIEESKREIYIADLWVPEDERRYGYGSAGFSATVNLAINKGIKRITGMITENDNSEGRLTDFYNKNLCKVDVDEKGAGRFELEITENIELIFENEFLRKKVVYLEDQVETLKNRINYQKEKIKELEIEKVNESKLVKFLKRF